MEIGILRGTEIGLKWSLECVRILTVVYVFSAKISLWDGGMCL